MFRSGLMHGERHPLNIAGGEEGEGGKEGNSREETKRQKKETFP